MSGGKCQLLAGLGSKATQQHGLQRSAQETKPTNLLPPMSLVEKMQQYRNSHTVCYMFHSSQKDFRSPLERSENLSHNEELRLILVFAFRTQILLLLIPSFLAMFQLNRMKIKMWREMQSMNSKKNT